MLVWNSCLFLGTNTFATDMCGSEGVAYILYWLTNTSLNLVLAFVLQELGATISYIGFTAALPFADLLFAWPLIMGSHASVFSFWSIAALVVVVVGLGLYRSRPESLAK